jgi:hypothetical protein
MGELFVGGREMNGRDEGSRKWLMGFIFIYKIEQ